MRPLGTAALAPALATVLLVLGGCADDTSSAGGSSSPSSTASDPEPSSAPTDWQGCSADDIRSEGRKVTPGDFDADGSLDELWLLPASTPCPGLAVTTADGVVGTDLDGLELSGKGTAAALSDGRTLAVLDGADHPRGGAQPHLFGLDGDELGEITADGQPVLPFVATDGGGAPTTATCTDDGGIEVVTATTAEPPGVVLAWDVQRTPYAIDGLEATKAGKGSVRTDVADPVLRKDMPDLFDGSLFADCPVRAAG